MPRTLFHLFGMGQFFTIYKKYIVPTSIESTTFYFVPIIKRGDISTTRMGLGRVHNLAWALTESIILLFSFIRELGRCFHRLILYFDFTTSNCPLNLYSLLKRAILTEIVEKYISLFILLNETQLGAIWSVTLSENVIRSIITNFG